MSKLRAAAALCAIVLGTAGCAGSVTGLGADMRRTDANAALRCRQLDAAALRAAHPDAALIARHDQLTQRVAETQAKLDALPAAEAQAEFNAAADPLTAPPGNVAVQLVQAKLDADAVYDAQGKQQTADSCWASLRMMEGAQQAALQHLQSQAASMGADQPTNFPVTPGAPVLSPPPMPSPGMALTPSNLGEQYLPEQGEVRLGSPTGPLISRYGSPNGQPGPTRVLIPVPAPAP